MEIFSVRPVEGRTECSLCGNECENVGHVLWECSAYSSTRPSFMKKLQELLEDDYEDFESLDVWEIRKHKLYDSDSGSGLQLRTQSSPGERSGKFSQNGKFGQNGKFS